MLSNSQFDCLYNIWKNRGKSLTQRDIAAMCDMSLGKINSIINELSDAGLVNSENAITDKGIEALEPYRVKNAVILAAGMSSRFAPLSYEKPKALLEVKGEILIEREIKQLKEAGINKITMVVGYLKEKLFYLGEKYNIDIVINEDYYRYNNTSSMILVTDVLDNTYICSSDNYFTENPFETYVYRAYYSAVYGAGKTNEYCIGTDNKGRINKVTIGGENAWYMLGHVYFDRAFSKKFTEILTREYSNAVTKSWLWEDLYMRHLDELEMYIRKYDDSIIKEFDSLDELRSFDEKYLDNSDSKIFKNICKILKVKDGDITDIYPIKTGLTNLSFAFSCKGVKYVYRHPGVGTENYINRKSEAVSMKVAGELELDKTFIYIDEEEGYKLSYFIEDARTLDYHNDKQVKDAMSLLKKLHNYDIDTGYNFDVWTEIRKFEERIAGSKRNDFNDMQEMHNAIEALHKYADMDGVKKCLCHCDSYDPNILIDKDDNMSLIDWEFSGMADYGCDIGTFIACSDYTVEEAQKVIEIYFGRKCTVEEESHTFAYVAAAAYYWFVWALYQESIGKNVGKYLFIWYKFTKQYCKLALDLYAKRQLKELVVKATKIAEADYDKATITRLGGLTNKTFRVELAGKFDYVARLAGEGTEDLINRTDEKASTEVACQIGIDSKLYYFDEKGSKVSDYIKNAVTMNPESMRKKENIAEVAKVFVKLHNSGIDTKVPFEVFEMAERYEKIILDNKVKLYRDYDDVKEKIMQLKAEIDKEAGVKYVTCHNDPLSENWVLGDDGMKLIDWEYAGMNDAMWDLADVSIEASYGKAEDDYLLNQYFGRKPTELEEKKFMANKLYIDYLWTLWGLTRVPFSGQEMQKYADDRYERLKDNMK